MDAVVVDMHRATDVLGAADAKRLVRDACAAIPMGAGGALSDRYFYARRRAVDALEAAVTALSRPLSALTVSPQFIVEQVYHNAKADKKGKESKEGKEGKARDSSAAAVTSGVPPAAKRPCLIIRYDAHTGAASIPTTASAPVTVAHAASAFAAAAPAPAVAAPAPSAAAAAPAAAVAASAAAVAASAVAAPAAAVAAPAAAPAAAVPAPAAVVAAAVPVAALTEVPAEVPTEVPVEVPTEVPAEVPAEVPVAALTEVPAEVPVAALTEVPAEVPAEMSDVVDYSAMPALLPPTTLQPPTAAVCDCGTHALLTKPLDAQVALSYAPCGTLATLTLPTQYVAHGDRGVCGAAPWHADKTLFEVLHNNGERAPSRTHFWVDALRGVLLSMNDTGTSFSVHETRGKYLLLLRQEPELPRENVALRTSTMRYQVHVVSPFQSTVMLNGDVMAFPTHNDTVMDVLRTTEIAEWFMVRVPQTADAAVVPLDYRTPHVAPHVTAHMRAIRMVSMVPQVLPPHVRAVVTAAHGGAGY